ncbi:MAG: MarR family winged helix-turn-helix transcriptional regulator [Thermomicrobiales bacterium]
MSELKHPSATRKTLDPARLAAWRAMLTAHAAAVGHIERDLSAQGLIPLTWYDVLFALSETPDQKVRLSELAERVLLSRSGLTRLVTRLETAGLLCREACPTDGRGAYAVLTPEGAEMLRMTWPAYARGIANHFAHHVTADEAHIIHSALERVIAQAKDS